MEWSRIVVRKTELDIATVLSCGQSFRWHRGAGDIWGIGLKGRVLRVKQDDDGMYYHSSHGKTDTMSLVEDYFNLKINLADLLSEWGTKDPKANCRLQGVRILRQDPWETLCAFICSSNNNIKRISKMVSSLCSEFGPHLDTIDGHAYHDFPDPQDLIGTEARLRELGFGYRAKYIAKTAEIVHEKGGRFYLDELRRKPYKEAKEALLELSGVGPKVADCVCLMALDKHDCVPVDTHIWQVAKRDYGLKFTQNAKGYEFVQESFRELWGEYAGWAQALIFAQDLREFAPQDSKRLHKNVKKEIKRDLQAGPGDADIFVVEPKRIKVE